MKIINQSINNLTEKWEYCENYSTARTENRRYFQRGGLHRHNVLNFRFIVHWHEITAIYTFLRERYEWKLGSVDGRHSSFEHILKEEWQAASKKGRKKKEPEYAVTVHWSGTVWRHYVSQKFQKRGWNLRNFFKRLQFIRLSFGLASALRYLTRIMKPFISSLWRIGERLLMHPDDI